MKSIPQFKIRISISLAFRNSCYLQYQSGEEEKKKKKKD